MLRKKCMDKWKRNVCFKDRSLPAHHTKCEGSQVGLIRGGFFKKALYELELRSLIQFYYSNIIL